MPYSELLPADLSSMSDADLSARLSELGYARDILAGTHTEEADVRRMKIDVAQERLRQEMRRRHLT